MIHISPTQLDTSFSCLRLFGFKYLTDLPKPPQEAGALLGSEVHSVAEAYLKNGTQPDRNTDPGRIFIGGLPYLPPPGSGGVEGTFSIEIGGIWFRGIVDLLTRGGLLPHWSYGDIPVVVDHKTSSNPKEYGLTPSTLVDNVQALLYVYYAIAKFNASTVGGRWLYYKTKGRELCYPVDMLWDSQDVFRRFEPILERARLLKKLWDEKPDPNSLDPSPESCDKYRGCPYRALCKITPVELSVGLFKKANQGDEKMIQSMKERLAAQQAAKQQPAPAPATPVVTQQPAPAPATPVVTQQTDGINPPIPGRTAPLPKPAPMPNKVATMPKPKPRVVETQVVEEAQETVVETRREAIQENLRRSGLTYKTVAETAEPESERQLTAEIVFTLPEKIQIASALIVSRGAHNTTPAEIANEVNAYLTALLG